MRSVFAMTEDALLTCEGYIELRMKGKRIDSDMFYKAYSYLKPKEEENILTKSAIIRFVHINETFKREKQLFD